MTQTYIKIQLTPEQIKQIESQRLNYGAIDPVSSFGDKPVQVQIEGTSGQTTFFYYGVTNEVFTLIPVTNEPIDIQPKSDNLRAICEQKDTYWRGDKGETGYSTCAYRNRSGQFSQNNKNFKPNNIYGKSLK